MKKLIIILLCISIIPISFASCGTQTYKPDVLWDVRVIRQIDGEWLAVKIDGLSDYTNEELRRIIDYRSLKMMHALTLEDKAFHAQIIQVYQNELLLRALQGDIEQPDLKKELQKRYSEKDPTLPKERPEIPCPPRYPLTEEECLSIGGHYYEVMPWAYASCPEKYERICKLCGHKQMTSDYNKLREWREEAEGIWGEGKFRGDK